MNSGGLYQMKDEDLRLMLATRKRRLIESDAGLDLPETGWNHELERTAALTRPGAIPYSPRSMT